LTPLCSLFDVSDLGIERTLLSLTSQFITDVSLATAVCAML